ncbi:ABC transporter permease [Halobacillus yeomjeoni]|uniref:ABC transporter permease n=1 Tax=Halobacillus yeomjeoni TaxID=311194 RepID=A0A931HW48_9BACI|nr:ABC transporter permease [Halobacillus yeomjeoni]MBH0230545.1 ABC transporter permease [Halobacillus yeomjeoni]
MRFLKFIGYYFVGVIGILLVSVSPALFKMGEFLSLSSYATQLQRLISQLRHPEEWVYETRFRSEPLFDYLWEPYLYSMTVLTSGILVGFSLAVLLAIITILIPNWAKTLLKRITSVFESVPDLLLAFGIQLFIVWFYKQTGLLVVDFVSVGSEKIYGLPILVLSVLPMLTMYKIMTLLFEEEMTKSYVGLVKSKGIEKVTILFVHVFRNIFKSAFYNSKIIVWGSLSSLLIIEYIFNMNGITSAFLGNFQPIVSFMILLLIFTPFFFVYQGTEMLLFKEDEKTEEVLKMNTFLSFRNVSFRIKWLGDVFKEIGAHFKNMKFLMGFSIIFIILCSSIVYTLTADPLIEKFYHITDESGKLVSAAPHTPEYVFLGTDALGFSIFDQLMVGAKYTIAFAAIIAFLRMILGFLFAVPFVFFLPLKVQKVMGKLIDSLHFLPMTIIALLLLRPVLMMPLDTGFETSEMERILYQGVILTLLAVPLVMTLFGNEFKLLMREEYVASTKILGGSSLHLLWKQLLPHLSARMGVIFGQQFIQTLLIFIHLGVFNIFFGGTKINRRDPPTSTTFEWSGMIGSAKDSLMTGRWWLIIPVLLGFMVLIVSMQMIIQGIKEVQQVRVGVPLERNSFWKNIFQRRSRYQRRVPEPQEESFVLVKEKERKSS